MKKCGRCKKIKNKTLFYKKRESPDGRSSICKDCHRLYSREVWYPANKEKQKKSSLSWRNRNRDKYLASQYQTTEAIVSEKRKESDGRCMICGVLSDLVLDHCHQTKKIRGFLCKKCNSGLGFFSDNIDKLKNAIKYLS